MIDESRQQAYSMVLKAVGLHPQSAIEGLVRAFEQRAEQAERRENGARVALTNALALIQEKRLNSQLKKTLNQNIIDYLNTCKFKNGYENKQLEEIE